MKTDFYTKCVLTVIAALLAIIAFNFHQSAFNSHQSVQAQTRNRMMKVYADGNGTLMSADSKPIVGTVDGFTCWGNGNCFAVWH